LALGYVPYALYAVFTLFAVALSLRIPWTSSAQERSLVSIGMVAAPPLIAVLLTTLLVNDILEAWILLVVGLQGLLALMLGVVLSPLLRRPMDCLVLRLVGWSSIAAILLIPASTALFAPIAGALAFLVPVGNLAALSSKPVRQSSSS
jgi:hypothetical protein